MYYRILKILRVIVAIAVLLAFLSFFLDWETLPKKAAPVVEKIAQKLSTEERAISAEGLQTRLESIAAKGSVLAKWQFIPAFFAGACGVFAALAIATFFFGRVYCSVLCPLGILQDVIAWFGKLFNRFKKPNERGYRYMKNPIFVRGFFLALAIVSTCVGGFFFALIEPYGVFGRIAANVFRPAWLLINNQIAAYCEKHELFSYGFYYIDVRAESVGAAVVGAISIVVLLVVAGKYGRLYCNSICPVGTILGAISKFSLFRMQIDPKRCVKCKMCSKACKSSCIDVENKRIDTSRCVVCFDCFSRCKMGAISYEVGGRVKLAPNETAKSSANAKSTALDEETLREKEKIQREIKGFDRGKRQFITLSLLATTAAIAKVAVGDGEEPAAPAAPVEPTPTDLPEGVADVPADYGLTPYTREFTISPPGSVSHERFRSKCVGCHLCVVKCPQRILKPSGFENGLAGFMQPRVDFTHAFCNFDCTVCGEVCPAGAILPLTKDEKHLVQTGHVVFIKDNCIVYAKDTSCGACAEHCPTQAIHMVPYKENLTIPETDVELCVGCGGCEYICPARPNRAVYIEGNPVHQQAKPVEVGETKEAENVDFGF